MDTSIDLQAHYENNKKQYEITKEKILFWTTKINTLREDLQTLSEEFQKEYEATALTDDLPEVLKAKLENRREGIRLSVKSASRLKTRLPDKVLIPEEFDSFKGVAMPNGPKDAPELNLEDNVAEENEELKEGSIEESKEETTDAPDEYLTIALEDHEKLLDQMQVHQEELEKRFVKFIEKSFAPVMDGLYSGLTYSSELQEDVKQNFPPQAEYVVQWVTVYQQLMSKLQALLDKYNVALLIPNKDDFFDENLHEPIAILPDENLQDEQIKEIVRYGYVYTGEVFGKENFLIRPAQVIVVKN